MYKKYKTLLSLTITIILICGFAVSNSYAATFSDFYVTGNSSSCPQIYAAFNCSPDFVVSASVGTCKNMAQMTSAESSCVIGTTHSTQYRDLRCDFECCWPSDPNAPTCATQNRNFTTCGNASGVCGSCKSGFIDILGTCVAEAFTDGSKIYDKDGAEVVIGGLWDGVKPGDIYYNDGNVGIGISSPVDELHIHATGGEAYSPWIRMTNDNTGGMSNDGSRFGIDEYGNLNINNYEDDKDITITLSDGGNVGIGISNPGAKLDVRGDTIKFASPSDDTHTWFPYTNGEVYITGDCDGSGNGDIHFRSYGDVGGYSDKMIIEGDTGRVGIGTGNNLGSGTESLIINSLIAGTSNYTEGITIGNNGSSAVKLGSSTISNRWGGIVWTTQDLRIESKTNIDFRTGTTDRMTIASNGNVTMNYDLSVVDDLTVGDYLTVNDGATIKGDNGANSIIVFQNNSSNDGADILSMRGTDFESTAAGSYYIKFYDSDPSDTWGYNGGIRNQSETSVAYATSSDARLKTNIKDYTDGLETLMNIKAREFEWIEDGSESIGFIAQELQPLFPYAVVGLPDSDLREDYMMIDYGRVTPLLVSAVQEQQQIIKDLIVRIEELEARVQ